MNHLSACLIPLVKRNGQLTLRKLYKGVAFLPFTSFRFKIGNVTLYDAEQNLAISARRGGKRFRRMRITLSTIVSTNRRHFLVPFGYRESVVSASSFGKGQRLYDGGSPDTRTGCMAARRSRTLDPCALGTGPQDRLGMFQR